MALIDINWKPSRNELRFFAGLQLVFFAIVACLLYMRFGWTTPAVVILPISALLAIVGAIWPAVLNPMYVIWMAAAFPIGWVVSHLLMAMIFYLLVTPVGLIMRLLGRDPLDSKFDKNANSYWKQRETRDSMDRYFRQY